MISDKGLVISKAFLCTITSNYSLLTIATHSFLMNPEWIGYAAAVLTTAAYVPQAAKVFKEKHTRSLSLITYLFITTGIALWFFYGLLIESPSLILANGVSFLLTLGILLMKIKHG